MINAILMIVALQAAQPWAMSASALPDSVVLRPGGAVTWNGLFMMTDDELRQELQAAAEQHQKVGVHVDAGAPHQRVADVMKLIRQSGVATVAAAKANASLQ
jgi:biopolymer transport protein ExbD